MANQSLSDLTTQLQNAASGNANNLVFNQTVISGSYNYQAVYALVGMSSFTVNVSDPTTNISYNAGTQTMTVTGTCNFYGLGNTTVTITMTGADVPSANCLLNTTFATFPLTTLATNNLIPSSTVSNLALALFSFNNVSLSIAAPTTVKGNVGTYTLSVGTTNSNDPIPLVPALGLSLSDPGLLFVRNATTNGLVTSALTILGTVNVGPMALLISLQVPVSPGTQPNIWTLTFTSGQGDQAVDLENLIQVLAGSNPFALLPSSLSILGDFGLLMLTVQFDFTVPTAPVVNNIFVNIGTGQGDWPVVSTPVPFDLTNVGFSITLNNPFDKLSSNTTVYIYGGFIVGKGTSTQLTLDAGMLLDITSGDWVLSVSGDLQTNGFTQLFASLPLTSGQTTPPDMPAQMDMTTITLNYLTIGYNASASSNTLSLIAFNIASQNLVFPIIPGVLSAGNPYANFSISNPTSSGNFQLTGTAGGQLMIGNVTFDLSASKPAANSGWTFEAAMAAGSTIDLQDLVDTFMSNLGVTLPTWITSALPTITELDFQITTPPASQPNGANSYAISGAAQWDTLDFYFIQVSNLQAEVKVAYNAVTKALSGSIMGSATIDNLITVQVGYAFAPNNNSILLILDGIVCNYNTTTNIITVSFNNTTLGSIISNLMSTIEPGFQLSFPWTFLNDINLSGLSMTINMDQKSPNYGVSLTYSSSIDLGFLKINSFTIAKTKVNGVTLAIDGSFLGLSTSDASSPFATPQPINQLPPVPGQGNSLFVLNLLAMGQRVGLQNAASFQHVNDVINALGNVTAPTGAVIPLQPGDNPGYDPGSNWLIATNFGIFQIPGTTQYCIAASAVFNDPNIYGFQLTLSGDKMKFLAGLSFEIMYKKISDSVGVYQIDFTLPAAIRNLNFGEFNIVLPSFGLQIYTNGDFLMDVGFPYNMDFSRSFSVNAIIWVGPIPVPVLGSAGFYFGKLSSATCPQVPQSTKGTFNPVIVFGIGAQLGLGYSVNFGILSAGFSLTAIGILEGIIATWQPYNYVQGSENQTDLSTSHYFWLKGTVGIMGKMWGTIDFAIIKASLDITIYATVSTTYESYMPMPFSFTLSVSVSLSVKINLFLFSITIHFSFNMTISQSFTVGSNNLVNAPWYDAPAQLQTARVSKKMMTAPMLQPLVLQSNAVMDTQEELNIYFIPHLTITGNETGSIAQQAAQYVAMLYIDTIPNGSTPTGNTSFEKLSLAVFNWVVSSYVSGASSITAAQLTDLYNQLSNGTTPIDIGSIMTFLQANFILNVQTLDSTSTKAQTLDATVFPIIPSLGLSVPAYNGAAAVTVDFETFTQCDDQYVTSVQQYFSQMMMQSSSGTETQKSTRNVNDGAPVSVATIVFEDYFTLIARQLVKAATDAMDSYSYTPAGTDSLSAIVTSFNNMGPNGLTIPALVAANGGTVLGSEVALQIYGVQYAVITGDTPLSIAVQFGLPVSQLALQNMASSPLLNAGVSLTYNTSTYTTTATDTFTSVATAFGVSLNTLAATGCSMNSQTGLLNVGIVMTANSGTYTVVAGDTFESIAAKYSITVSALALQNTTLEQLLVPATAVFYNGLVYVIQPTDTLATVAARFGTDAGTMMATENSVFSNTSLLITKSNMLIAGARYQVQATDTLSSIQSTYNAMQAVNISDMLLQNRFLPGLILANVQIPVTGQTTYTTLAGDTISSIINAFPGVAIGTLATAMQDIPNLLRAQSFFYIPTMTYTTASGNTTDTLQSVASQFQTQAALIGSVPANQVATGSGTGIFAATASVSIPNLQSISISLLSAQVSNGTSITQSSGMVSRYLMHGLRLPVNSHITFSGTSPCGSAADCALYNLTGQQFSLPAAFTTTNYTLSLTNATPGNGIQFNGSATSGTLTVTLTANNPNDQTEAMITSVLAFAQTTGILPQVTGLTELPPYAENGANFTFRASVPWQPGSALTLPTGGSVAQSILPEIWSFPPGLIQAVNAGKTLQPLMLPYLSNGGDTSNANVVGAYGWGTLLNVTIRKSADAPPFCYELVGADEAGTQLLQNLLSYMNGQDNSVINDIAILYPASGGGSFLSDGNSNIVSYLLQSNLSTVTNPPTGSNAKRMLKSAMAAPTGILNSHYNFIELLWECSITRSGGFYIYYNVFESGNGLPDQLFQDSSSAVINIFVTYQQQISGGTANLLYNFMNSLVTGVSIDPSKDVVYAQSQLQNTTYTVAAGVKNAQNSISIANIIGMYNVLPSDLVLDNQTAALNTANLQISVPSVYYQMKNGDTLASVATYFSAGALTPVTAAQLQAQNPNVIPGPWALLYIGDITLVTGKGGPTNTLGGVMSYYDISADALSVANLTLAGIFANNTVLSISDQIVTRTSVLPSGSSGYWMSRTTPADVPASPTDPTYPNLYLQNAYNQLAAKVLPNAYFNTGTPGMPVGPTDNNPDMSQRSGSASGNEWQYSQAIPLNAYAINRGMVNVPGLPQDSGNPYAGIGNMVQINLDWRDLFGNYTVTPFSNPQLGSGAILNNVPVQVGYTDNVIPVSSWPNVSSYYVVNQDVNKNPQIVVGVLFDKTPYTVSGSVTAAVAMANAQQDIVTYTGIYYQLCQVVDPKATTVVPSISAVVSSSLMTDSYTFSSTQFSSLLTFVQNIYLYLYPIANGISTVPPAPTEVDFNIPLSIPGLPTASIFEVEVSLSIVRPISQVHDDFQDVVSVWNGSMDLQLPTMANNTNIVTIQDFATAFEAALKTTGWQLKIATGMPDVTGASASGQSIWAIQWGLQTGQNISVAINNAPVFYAVSPLANSLESDPKVPVYAYTTGTGLSTTPQTIAISGVDMDTWALNCLSAIETMLSPQYSAPMYMLGQLTGNGTDYQAQLLGYKQTLAKAIMAQVTNILATQNPSAPALTDAQQQMYQQLLNNLTTAYSVNAVIQFPATVSSPYPNGAEPIAPNIFGVPVTADPVGSSGTTPDTAPYSLSTAKIPMDNTATSYLTFMFNVNTPGNQSSFEFNIQYQITHVEHEIQTVPGINDGYLGSQWLNFVNQPAQTTVGDITVPVLLRAYPTPPSTLNQTYTPLETISTIQDARTWDYGFTYASSHEAQDSINAVAEFNLAPVMAKRMASVNNPNLLHELAEFNSVYPAILQDLNTYLLQITRNTQTTDTAFINAQAAVISFLQVIQKVSIAWPYWVEDISQFNPPNMQASTIFEFSITEAPLNLTDPDSALVLSLNSASAIPAGLNWPLVEIDNYTNQPDTPADSYQYVATTGGATLEFSQAQDIANRNVNFESLDILTFQNAWASVSMTRNAFLLPGIATNPAFIYQTPYVSFANKTVPLLNSNAGLDISAMNNSGKSQPATLLQHMTNLFTQLFAGDTASTELIKLSCTYFYSVNDSIVLPQIQMPVLLATPFSINIPADCAPPSGGCPAPFTTGSTFVCNLTAALQQWFTTNTPATLDGNFIFTIALFSKIDPTNQLPVLQLNNLTLSLDKIQPQL